MSWKDVVTVVPDVCQARWSDHVTLGGYLELRAAIPQVYKRAVAIIRGPE